MTRTGRGSARPLTGTIVIGGIALSVSVTARPMATGVPSLQYLSMNDRTLTDCVPCAACSCCLVAWSVLPESRCESACHTWPALHAPLLLLMLPGVMGCALAQHCEPSPTAATSPAARCSARLSGE